MNDAHEEAEESFRLEGRYANYFKIGYSAFEFLLDFGQIYGEHEDAQLHTRIVTGPSYALMLLKLLQDSLAQYQNNFGALASANHEADDAHQKEITNG